MTTDERVYQVEAIARPPNQHVRASVRVKGTDYSDIIDRALRMLEETLHERPKYIIVKRTVETREDQCDRCKRYVLARETGLADTKTGRVWCKRCAIFAR